MEKPILLRVQNYFVSPAAILYASMSQTDEVDLYVNNVGGAGPKIIAMSRMEWEQLAKAFQIVA
jgi:hypothetical protein